MNYLFLYIAVAIGFASGFFLCTLLKASHDKKVFTVDNVVKWLKVNPDMDKAIYLIVRRVYEGKRTIHKNPIRKKVAE